VAEEERDAWGPDELDLGVEAVAMAVGLCAEGCWGVVIRVLPTAAEPEPGESCTVTGGAVFGAS